MTVVILSKTASNLIPCVEAVRKNEPGSRIIVVDDGIEGWSDTVDVFRVAGVKPFIFARNANIGIAACDDDVMLLNDDALLTTYEGFTLMAQAQRDHPQYGIIGATCSNVGNQNQWPRGVGLRLEPRMVCFVCAYIPRSTIDKIGLLDEEFIGYGFEDDSYCLRIRRAGLLIGIHDGCYCDHGSLKSTFRGDPKTPANLAQNEKIFRQKWGAGNHQL